MHRHGDWGALHRRLIHAQLHIPLYRDLWRRSAIDVRRFRGMQDFATLPALTRRHLMDSRLEDRLDPAYPARALRPYFTSGSTGEPLQWLFDDLTLRRRQFRFLRALWGSGYRPGQSIMLVSSRSTQNVKSVSRWARFARWHYVDLYDGEQTMLHAYRRILPGVLYAPLNALRMIADAAGSLRDLPPPRLLISTGEQLAGSAAIHLREAFGTSVTDFYGMTETGVVAWKPAGAVAYHIDRSMYLEFIPLPDGNGCEQLVITDMTAGAMPLFRYLPGDLVRRDVGLPGAPVIELEGKQLDCLLLPDGHRISAYRVDEALGTLPGLARYEVLQQADLALDVRIRADAQEVHAAARAALVELCNGQVPVRIEAWPTDMAAPRHKARPVRSLATGIS